jgi:hypothetical protein
MHSQGVEHAGIAFAHPQRATVGRMVLALTSLWRDETLNRCAGRCGSFDRASAG